MCSKLTITVGILVCTATPVAFAQQTTASDESVEVSRGQVAAPRNAFEVGVEGGYTQPFGEVNPVRKVSDIANAGGAIGLLLGWRINPRWSVGVTGQYNQNTPDTDLPADTSVFGVSAGLLATFHMMPYGVVDPYASLGTGYRGLFMSAVQTEPDVNLHGWQIARLLLGLDFRTSSDIAVGPVVGADVNTFLATDNKSVTDPGVNTFIFAGANARFDIGGTRVGGPVRQARLGLQRLARGGGRKGGLRRDPVRLRALPDRR